VRLTGRRPWGLLLTGTILAGCGAFAPKPDTSEAPTPSPSGTAHCLLGGFWHLQPASFNAFLGGLAGDTIDVMPATGVIELSFDDQGQASFAADDFAAGLQYETSSGAGTTLLVQITVIGNGLGAADYSLNDKDSNVTGGAQGKITFSNVIGGINLESEVTINGQPGELPIEFPSPLGAGTADYTCDPLLLVMEPSTSTQSFTYDRVDAPPPSPGA
jgi:hypothetical protein